MKKAMTRIAACSLAVLIAFNSALVPRSKAVGAEMVGTAALATSTLAAYMTATGVPLTVTAGGAAAASAGAASLISGYAAATGGTYSVVTTAIASGVTIGTGGTILIGVAAAAILAGIVAWTIDKFGLIGEDGTPVENVPIDGVSVLPFVPDSALVDRPYVVIYQSVDGSFWAMCSAEPAYIYLTNNGYSYAMRNCVGCDFKDGVWSVHKPNPDVGLVGVRLVSSIWSNHDISHDVYGVTASTYTGIFPSAESNVYIGLDDNYEAPPKVEDQYSMVIDTGMSVEDEQAFIDSVLAGVAAGTLNPTYNIEIVNRDTVVPGEVTDTQAGILSWVKTIAQRVSALPQSIAEAVKGIFVPDAALTTQITDAFAAKFSFVPTLHRLGTDLLSIGPDSKPPVVYIHLEDAEGSIDYGGTVKALDMSWYERYKEDGDRIIGGFLWLGFLWLLFKRVPAIINGGEMVQEYTADIDRGSKRRKQ